MVAFNAALNSICTISGCTVEELDQIPVGSRLANANELRRAARRCVSFFRLLGYTDALKAVILEA